MKQPLFSYITIAFIAPAGVFFCCTNNSEGYSHGLIFFHGRCSSVLENVIFSTKPTGLFDIRTHIAEYWRL